MKRTLLFIMCVLASLTMSAQDGLAVEDIQNNGCQAMTRGEEYVEPVPTIVLTKEGSTLSVQLLNYVENCCVQDFGVVANVSGGGDGAPCSVSIIVSPDSEYACNCICPFNVSFTVRDLEPNSFYLDCWWYKGIIVLTEGEPLVLEYNNPDPKELLYGEWRLVGWNDGGNWFEVDPKYVGHHHLSIEIPKEGYVKAYSMVNEIVLGLLTLNGNELLFDGDRGMTKVNCDIMENQFFEDHIFDIKSYQMEGKLLKLYYTDNDFFEFCDSKETGNDYRPLVEEGKHWTYDNYMPLRPAEYDHYYYYDLKGDTLIAGKKCLKMYSENEYNDSIIRYKGALYEEGKKVYCFFPQKDEAVLLYDFDCKVGDTFNISTGLMVVKDIQTEDNGGIAIRKYTLHAEDDIDFCWIEGVGATKDFFGMLPMPGNYNTLKACELNGEKLYQTIEPDMTAKGYHKMGIEGKRWNYIHYYLDEDGEHRDPYSYVVKGDTIIRRTTYKKLWYQDEKTERFVCLLYESGRTVYKNTDLGNNSYDSPLLTAFFDFSRDDFGRVFTWKAEMNAGNTNWMPYGVDTIMVNNCPFRRYTCLQKYSEEGEKLTTIEYDGEGVWHDIWVEGVGSESRGIEDQIPFHEPYVRRPGEYTCFVSCYENGECIFTAADFNAPATKHDINIAYRPFVEEGKVWKAGAFNSGNPVQIIGYYYFDGDTIIDGKTCKQMMRQQYISHDFPYYDLISPQDNSLSYVGAWYEEDQKVYKYDSINNQFKLMYDFSIEANGTLEIDNFQYVIGPRQTGGLKGFKGVYRDVMWCEDGEQRGHSATWLEGVGGIYGPTTSVTNGYVDPAWFLMSCIVGDEVIYLNDEYEDGATPEGAEARKRLDFTHTIKTKPKAPRKEGANQQLYGEYNNLQLSINLNPLNEAYTVRITDETGKAVYEKDINAGSIVGLNIDISAYVAGRYTVTVENSSESFTGVFDTQTTEIVEVREKTEKTSGYIYNLQGQRISSLQKGLNIVNGQKVYVK